ncbi:MAG: M20/M25/M40 family metallo-hydrolase [Gammaproteobacteria bacterium]|nr:M20/M25/M40 family metallo-hydrolase [Pseudomonadales bacterium]MCP5349343.1 M20/M25/M40 family metallo-hydrolase [Pseudomonadales bacterium]
MLKSTLSRTALALLLCWQPLLYAQLDPTEQAMVSYINSNNADAEALLIESVNLNSGSMNFTGVREVGNLFQARFDALGFTTRWEDGAPFGRAGHLIAEYHGGGDGPKLLLIGHLDTVFEPDSPFQSFTRIDADHATGPGISDMKGGDVIILQALGALREVGALEPMEIVVVMTGDEELSGDPLSLSKKALIDAAAWADIAIGFENGDGNPATANISRRGSSGWVLEVTGTPAHSSQVFREDIGPGAIYETARILTLFLQNLQQEENLTFNPGRIIGGTDISHDDESSSGTAFGKNNVVAEYARVTGDLRAVSLEQLERARNVMRAIAADNFPHTSATITFSDGYPPLAPTDGNARLLEIYSQASQDLGLGVVAPVNPRLAGAADVSFTAGLVEMAIDGLGMSGSAGHTVDETGVLSALPNQSKRAALLLYRLTR